MKSREKRNLVSSKDEKKQHRVRVLLGEECVRKNANEVQVRAIYCLVVILRMRCELSISIFPRRWRTL